MRACATLAGAIAGVILACAGCTSSPARPQASHTTAAAPVPPLDRALPSPGCSTATARSPLLSHVGTALVGVPGNPFGVAVTPDGHWAFVALGSSVEVLRTGAALAPVKVATLNMAQPGNGPPLTGLLGVTLTRDGQYLLVAAGSGAVVISVARAEQGRTDAVLGTLAGFGAADFVGSIPLGLSPVGMAVSPDGHWLYVTSEVTRQAPQTNQGTLTVVNLVNRAASAC